jgi:hypothetical protein
MTDSGTEQSTTGELPEWWVTIRAFGPDDEPGEARHEQYVVEAKDQQSAKEKAVEKGKNHFTRGIIGRMDSYEVVEVSGPHE